MNETIYHGTNQPNTDVYYYNPIEIARRLLMAVVLVTITDALGETSNCEKQRERITRKQEAIVYILSKEFELNMKAIGYPHKVRQIRMQVVADIYRIPLGYNEQVEEYKNEEVFA